MIVVQLGACATVLSSHVLQQITPNVSARDVIDDPERFRGRVILIAGSILRTENRGEGTLLEILAYPTTHSGLPDTSEPASGRLSLRYPGYLESVVYRPGRMLVSAAQVAGRITGDGSVRPQPLLHSLELRLLPEPPAYYLPFHIGVGFMFGF